MQALVLGGAGAMGQAVARDLIKQEQVKKVILGDINTDPSRLQDKLRNSKKVLLSRVDLNDHEGLVRVIKGVDVVINCAGPFYRTAITVSKAAIEARVNYIDICDDYEVIGYLFDSEIDRAAKENNDPEHIAIAFGIVTDKKGFGLKKSEKKTEDVGPMKKKDRMDAYKEING